MYFKNLRSVVKSVEKVAMMTLMMTRAKIIMRKDAFNGALLALNEFYATEIFAVIWNLN